MMLPGTWWLRRTITRMPRATPSSQRHEVAGYRQDAGAWRAPLALFSPARSWVITNESDRSTHRSIKSQSPMVPDICHFFPDAFPDGRSLALILLMKGFWPFYIQMGDREGWSSRVLEAAWLHQQVNWCLEGAFACSCRAGRRNWEGGKVVSSRR